MTLRALACGGVMLLLVGCQTDAPPTYQSVTIDGREFDLELALTQDERYRGLFGKRAVTPLFRVPVPVFPSEKADPEKGTGILMVCTFGDQTDVEWWREQELPLRQLVADGVDEERPRLHRQLVRFSVDR